MMVLPEYAFAGPGGFIVKGFFKTWYGKLILVLLGILILPVIIYFKTQEYFGVRRSKKLINSLATINGVFEWTQIHKSIANIVVEVHEAWSTAKLDQAQEHMTEWYWQNQQLTILNRWKELGLRNVCNFYAVEKIKPIHVAVSDSDDFNDTRIAFSIQFNREDYLINEVTRKVVEGAKGYESEKQVWVMVYDGANWKLDDIQPDGATIMFCKAKNLVPAKVQEKLAISK